MCVTFEMCATHLHQNEKRRRRKNQHRTNETLEKKTRPAIQWIRVAKTTYSMLLNNLFIAVYFIMTVVSVFKRCVWERERERQRDLNTHANDPNNTSTWISCFMYRFIAQFFLSVSIQPIQLCDTSIHLHSHNVIWMCRSWCVRYVAARFFSFLQLDLWMFIFYEFVSQYGKNKISFNIHQKVVVQCGCPIPQSASLLTLAVY